MARYAHARQTDRGLLAAVLIGVFAPVGAFVATSGNVDHVDRVVAAGVAPAPAANAAADGWQVVPVSSWAPPSIAQFQTDPAAGPVTGQVVAASRYRIAASPDIDRLLPEGVANERGLQVKTILAARSISAVFPEIKNIGGVRPDSLPWHPNGLAIDVMIPNPSSAAGIALGDQIVAYVMKNAKKFGMQDCIWRGTYYTPSGPSGSGNGHYDHVHVTTTGGGYPTGGESYYR